MREIAGFRQRLTLFAFVLVSWAVIALIGWNRSIEVDYMSFAPFWGIGIFFYIAAFLLVLVKDQYISAVCEIIGALFLLVIPIFLSTFFAISVRMPLADDWLVSADRAIGFDWISYIHFIDQFPLLIRFFSAVYDVFFILILAVPLLLVANRDIERAFAFIFGFEFLSFLSSFISIWFPSMGAFYSYGVQASDMEYMVPIVGYGFLEQFLFAYSGNLETISVGNLSGILSFPSVHAGVAFWVFWTAQKIKGARWPICFIALSMAISAISHGSHYMVDILAGLAVAAFTAFVTAHCFLAQRSLPIFSKPIFGLAHRFVYAPVTVPKNASGNVLQDGNSNTFHDERPAS